MAGIYLIEPYHGFGDINFNEKRDDVRKNHADYKIVHKNGAGHNTVDRYLDFFAYYDDQNLLEAVEFFSGEVLLNGERIFPKIKEEFLAHLHSLGAETVLTDGCIDCEHFGISAYAPESNLETLLIHRRGYFD